MGRQRVIFLIRKPAERERTEISHLSPEPPRAKRLRHAGEGETTFTGVDSSRPLVRSIRTPHSSVRLLSVSHVFQLDASLQTFFRRKMMMMLSETPLQTFSHAHCGTEGWAEQVTGTKVYRHSNLRGGGGHLLLHRLLLLFR